MSRPCPVDSGRRLHLLSQCLQRLLPCDRTAPAGSWPPPSTHRCTASTFVRLSPCWISHSGGGAESPRRRSVRSRRRGSRRAGAAWRRSNQGAMTLRRCATAAERRPRSATARSGGRRLECVGPRPLRRPLRRGPREGDAHGSLHHVSLGFWGTARMPTYCAPCAGKRKAVYIGIRDDG